MRRNGASIMQGFGVRGMAKNGKQPQRLIQARLLDCLSAQARAAVSGQCRWREYPAGAVIVSYENRDDHVLFIQRGRVRATIAADTGRQVAYRDIGPGEVVGDFAAIDGLPRSADVVALEDVLVAAMPASQFLSLLREHPEMALVEMQELVAVIRGLTDRVLNLSSKVVTDRLCNYLFRIAEPPPDQTPAPWIVQQAPTHQEIAAHISTYREAVTRGLRHLEESGVIDRDGRQLRLHPDKLPSEIVGGVVALGH